MTDIPTPRLPAARAVVAPALVLLLALGWVVAAAVAAEATVVRYGFESPSDGAQVEQTTTIGAYVDHGPPGEVDRVEVRFLRGGAVAGGSHVLQRTDDVDTGGGRRTRFASSFDPMASAWHGGGVAANGRYILEMRVRERYTDAQERWTPWTAGPQITVNAAPPATRATARLADPETRSIEVGWETVGTKLPDFTRYVVQRAAGGNEFGEVYVSLDASEGSFTDVVPDDGTYRYRVTVHRLGGDGGERASAPADSPAVDTQAGQDPAAEETSRPREDSEEPGADGGGDDGLRNRSSGSISPSSGPSGSLPSSIRPRSTDTPEAAGPGVGPSSIFEGTLDYGEIPEGERTITDRRLVAAGEDAYGPSSGGMLNIMERELAPEQILVPVAAGLVFTLAGLHIRRFLRSPG
jgi:hypothetical protein